MDIEFTLLIPEFILAGLGFFVLTVDMLMPRSWDSRRNGVTAASAALGLALVFVVALVRGWDEVEQRILYDQLILVDRYALLFKALFTATGFAVVLMSVDYVGRKMRHPGEFYAMIVFAVLGATLMAETGEGLLWLAAIAIVNSVISLYYYLRIVRTMYMDEAEDGSPLPVPLLTKGALWLLFAGTVAVGVYPGPWVDAIDAATVALGPLS